MLNLWNHYLRRECPILAVAAEVAVQLFHDGVCLLGELLLDVGGVERLQQLGAEEPEQQQQQQADGGKKPHQLPADADGAPLFGFARLPHGEQSLRLQGRVGVELVADAPHGGDIAAAFAKVPAQHLHMGVHGAILAEVVVVPHFLQDLLAAEGDALVGGEKDQQVKLLGRQADFLTGHPDGMAGRVDGQITEDHGPGGVFRAGQGAVEHGAHPRHQFPGGEGLDHIIVGTALQPGQLVVFFAPGGQDDDGGVDAAAAHFPQAGHAVHERHHDVQNDQIVSAAGQQRQCCRAVARFLADIACIL